MGIYTQIPAAPNKKLAESVLHTPLLARWLHRQRNWTRLLDVLFRVFFHVFFPYEGKG